MREVQDVRVAYKLRTFGKGVQEMPKKIVALQFEEQEGIITVVGVKWCTSWVIKSTKLEVVRQLR